MAQSIYIPLASSPNQEAASISEDTLQELMSAARGASANAYCPCSHFPVGAAVITEDGQVSGGCNVENVSYGLTICAERNAIFQAVAKGQHRIRALLIYTPTPTPVTPCGACRQVLAEFADDAEVIAVCDGEQAIRTNVKALLALPFHPPSVLKPLG